MSNQRSHSVLMFHTWLVSQVASCQKADKTYKPIGVHYIIYNVPQLVYMLYIMYPNCFICFVCLLATSYLWYQPSMEHQYTMASLITHSEMKLVTSQMLGTCSSQESWEFPWHVLMQYRDWYRRDNQSCTIVTFLVQDSWDLP